MAVVLIIEDEANIRMFISANLEVRGYTVLEAGTGTAGLELLRDRVPDALILDMLLPDMEGRDVLEAMARDEALKAIPVVLMTASVNATTPQKREYPNLVERLTKPTSVATLIDAVQKALA